MLTTSNRQSRSPRGATVVEVASVVAVAGHDDRTVVGLASCLAPGLGPALASAICESARERGLCVELVDEVDETTPAGVAGAVNGHSVLVGNAALFSELDLSLESLGDGPERLRRRGEHVMFVSIDRQIAGFFGVVHARD